MAADYPKWENVISQYNEHLSQLTLNELAVLEKELNIPLNAQHKEFLLRFGGCFCGVSIYGKTNSELLENRSIVDLNAAFSDQIPQKAYVISFDGSCNPIYIDSLGQVLLFDHDIGEHELLACDFNSYINDNILD